MEVLEMKDILIAIISSGLLSGALAALISSLSTIKTRKEMKKFADNYNAQQLTEGLKLILLSTLKRDGKDALDKKRIGKSDYEAFLASYNAYKALGGDGWADKVHDQVKNLPVDIDD